MEDSDRPDFKNRSVLAIQAGSWVMRNGHIASVEKIMHLPYGNGKHFPVWFGRCKGCGEPKTRNENGTYAAIGKHSNDILRKS